MQSELIWFYLYPSAHKKSSKATEFCLLCSTGNVFISKAFKGTGKQDGMYSTFKKPYVKYSNVFLILLAHLQNDYYQDNCNVYFFA